MLHVRQEHCKLIVVKNPKGANSTAHWQSGTTRGLMMSMRTPGAKKPTSTLWCVVATVTLRTLGLDPPCLPEFQNEQALPQVQPAASVSKPALPKLKPNT